MTDASSIAEVEVIVSRDCKIKFTVEANGKDDREVIRKVFDYADLIYQVWGEKENERERKTV